MNQNPSFALPPALREILNVLGRQKRFALAFFVGAIVMTVLVTGLTPRTYRSEAKLLLRLGRENATLDQTALLGQESVVAVPNSREAEINSVVEILLSRSLLEKVVEAVGPAAILGQSASADASSPATRDRAIRALAERLKAAPIRKTNLVELTCQAQTPELAQKLLGKVIDLYLDEHIRLNRPPEIHEFFVAQTARLQKELTHKEKDLCDLKSATGIASVPQQREAIVKRLNRLQDDLLEVEASRAAAASKVEALKQQLAGLPEMHVATETTGVGNEGTDRMRDQFYALQLKKEEAAAKLTPNHPAMQRIEQQIAACKEILDRQTDTRVQTTTTVSRQYEDTQKSLLEEEPVLVAMQTKAAMLQTQIAGARLELKRFGDDELRIAALERDVETLQGSYHKYAANLEQTRVDQALEAQRMSNISVAQTATLEARAVGPHTASNLLLSLVLGAVGGLGLALVRDRLSRPTSPAAQSFPQPAAGGRPTLSVVR